jgi:hypothetical protein
MIPQAIRVEAAGSLAGQIIGDTSAAPQCTTCGAHLFAETEVTGYAYRFTYERNLSLARLYCNEWLHTMFIALISAVVDSRTLSGVSVGLTETIYNNLLSVAYMSGRSSVRF